MQFLKCVVLEYWTVDRIQELGTPKCNASSPSSGPFRKEQKNMEKEVIVV
jgi:hypothetical protein